MALKNKGEREAFPVETRLLLNIRKRHRKRNSTILIFRAKARHELSTLQIRQVTPFPCRNALFGALRPNPAFSYRESSPVESLTSSSETRYLDSPTRSYRNEIRRIFQIKLSSKHSILTYEISTVRCTASSHIRGVY